MNFEDSLQTLFSRTQVGVGLKKLACLLDKLGRPQRKIRAIHVAGTNGKGTVCTVLARALHLAGHKTGLFLSPHLITPAERIQINGTYISQDDFARLLQIVLSAEEEPLNFFELLTAVAFLYFAQENVAFAVLETGLGGRKDPTNLCATVLSIITSIGLDHTQILGGTLEKIAAEKAGIIKPGVAVLCGSLEKSSAEVIAKTALQQKAALTWVKEGEPFSVENINFCRAETNLHFANQQVWPLHAVGEKQPQNACLVYQAAKRFGIEDSVIKQAFQTVVLPGRFEVFTYQGHSFVLDGAHNLQAIQALMQCWQKTPWAKTGTLLCGFMQDKDYAAMLTCLQKHFTRIILTTPPSQRAVAAERLRALIDTHKSVQVITNYEQAIRLAAGKGPVLCTGSFYLVGAVRRILEGCGKN